MEKYKTCTKCGEKFEATLEFFYKRKDGKFGLSAKCKTCVSKYMKKYRIENPEWHRKYRVDNADHIKQWRIDNTEHIKKCRTENAGYYKKSKDLGPGWQVDHVQPVSKGGLWHPKNLQIVTKSYNLEKGAKLDFRLPTEKEIHRI